MLSQCPKCRSFIGVTEETLVEGRGLVHCVHCGHGFDAIWNLVDARAALKSARDAGVLGFDPEDAPFENPIVSPIEGLAEHGGVAPGPPNRLSSTAPAPARNTGLEAPPGSPPDSLSDAEIRRTLRLDEALDPDFAAARSRSPERARRDPRNPSAQRSTRLDAGVPASRSDRVEPRLDAPRPTAPGGGRREILGPPRKPAAAHRYDPGIAAGAARADPNAHWASIAERESRAGRYLWAVGALSMLVLLVVQARFVLVDELYAIPRARPYVALLCELTACAPPTRSDPGSIRIAQTRIDLHPETPGALSIKVNLLNRADFAQPYPALRVTLSDKDGRVVGRRTYDPGDYLAGGAERALLDPGVLAAVTIDLARPNENAVGFETELVE